MLRKQTACFLVIAALAFGTGCSEEVSIPAPIDRHFSLYGALTPQADTQWVRVFEVTPLLKPTVNAPLGATFTSVDEATGEVVTWRDSVVASVGGEWSHVFWAPFRAQHGHTYRLAVQGDAGRFSRVTVPVPAPVRIEFGEPRTAGLVILPLDIVGQPPQLLKPTLTYHVITVTGYSESGLPVIRVDEIPFDIRDWLKPKADGWHLDINLSDAYRTVSREVRKQVDYVTREGVTLALLTLSTTVGNAEWQAPNGNFDEEVLMQPGIMSNVENGFGFVGGGFMLSQNWRPPPDVVEASGFRPCCP